MIGCVWKMLRFKAERGTVPILGTPFQGVGSVHKITGIKLQAGFGGKHVHFNAAVVAYSGSGMG
jgi:hypothetical protein